MNCSNCRKTSVRQLKTVFAPEDGKLARKRVCQDCYRKALPILAQHGSGCSKCGKPATLCHVCASHKETVARKDGADVKAIVKKLRAFILTANEANARMSEDVQTDHWNGRIEGLESAIELLESGRW